MHGRHSRRIIAGIVSLMDVAFNIPLLLYYGKLERRFEVTSLNLRC